VKILIADDHELLRLALRVALQPLEEGVTFVEAASAESALAAVAANPDLDLVLIDMNMPGIGGLEGVRALRASHPSLPLVACSAAEDPGLVAELMALGVAAYIPKSDSTQVILQATRLVLAGGTYVPPRLAGRASPAPDFELTARQQEVLRLLAQGKPNKAIARELDISEATVKVHLVAVFRALGARNRTEAVVIAQRRLPSPG
jgi:DNA-binding NarL/FixJ family response regulator